MKIQQLLFILFLSTLITFSCQEKKATPAKQSHLGQIQLKVTGDETAQAAFEKGLLLLHSFEFDDACTAFLEAQKQDSTFLMAYWGEAMTYNHPLWRQQNFEKGKNALVRFDSINPNLQLNGFSKLEQDFWKAAETLYAEEGDKKSRDQTYSDHLKMMYQNYPENHEVAAFYALSILGAVPVGRDTEAYEKAARVAQGIIAENPNHPGALHYTIHSYDDPGHAKFALNAAKSYSKVAPDAAHALHMPSHIYVAMGMWDEVVTSNIASYDASVKRMERLGLDDNARSYHAFHWLLYGLLQKGKIGEAKQIMGDMESYLKADPASKQARNYMIRMKGNFLVETGDWDGDFAQVEVDQEGLNISMQAVYNYINGRQAYIKKEVDALHKIIKNMEKERVKASLYLGEGGATMCSNAPVDYKPNQLDVDQALILEMELQALAAQLKGDKEAAENWFQKAVDLQDNTSYAYGPPVIIEPTYELYGNWLMQEKRFDDALAQFEKALEKGPNRSAILQQQLKIYQALNDEKQAKETLQQLKANWKDADESLKTEVFGDGQLSESM